MTVIIKILQLLFALSILILVHEFGHFLFAKIFKVKVEKFYIFFDYKFSLLKFNYKGTEYGIGWIPLGGYTKIAGMVDESMDTDHLKNEPQPWEFRSKKAWQRFLILFGGVLMNVLLAIVINIFILWNIGEQYLPNSSLKYGLAVDSTFQAIGLRNGDLVVAIDDHPVNSFTEIIPTLLLEKGNTIIVQRGDSLVYIPVPSDFLNKLIKQDEPIQFFFPRFPFIIDSVVENSAAALAGLQKGDKIIGIQDTITPYFTDIKALLQNYKDQEVDLWVVRNNDTITLNVAVLIDRYHWGDAGMDLSQFFEIYSYKYTFWQSIPRGFNRTWEIINSYVKQLGLIFSKEVKGYEGLGGFITMGKIFPGQWNWLAFWNLTAFLSIMLAVLNIIPIPGLDGGHILFVLVEMITGRKPSEKFLIGAQFIGLMFLLALVIYANLNDIIRLFR
ncbi:MAG: RIP metalloprotease RseP [Bacteroidales bacterium]|nr:RIP metalloprotease RseP [Bacteroidales bacterium]